MAKKTNLELVKYVKTKIGSPYLYGFKQTFEWNRKCTLADYNNLKKTYGSMVWSSDKDKCVGKYPCDCSGLISAYTGVLRGSANHKEVARKVLPIKDITKAEKGCLLWMNGHIGVLISVGKRSDGSDSYYVAEDGSAYGCQKMPVSWQKWTHILWSADIEYVKEPVKPVIKKVNYKVVTNREVCIRKKPMAGTDGNTIKRLEKGHRCTIVAETVVDGVGYGQLKVSGGWIKLKLTSKL